ncbi:MAG: O-antigen ligase family protein [Candidatus Daviesbacteria bacterium]|nr:O-antigen ligase family protein [Candidatus Daviesbacteria bacterium]
MTNLLGLILAFAISAGQLIRIPFANGGITILDIIIAFFCLWGLLKTKFQLHKPPARITAALIFISLAIASLILTPLHLKLNEYITGFLYIIRFALYILIAWLIFSDAFGDFRKSLQKTLLLAGISFAVLGLLQFIIFPNLEFLSFLGWDPHYFRTVSTFLDPNFAGAFLVLTLILIFQNLAMAKKWNTLFFIITYAALLTTFSRSSYFMFLVSGLTFSLSKKSKKYTVTTLLLFTFLLLGFQIYNRLVAIPQNINREQSASLRLNTWQQGFQIFQKNPILGIGFNAYRYAIREYSLGDEQFLKSHGASSNDSSLLFVASTTGILGLISYLYFLWTLIKSSTGRNLILISGLTGLLIHSFFANSLFYPPILVWVLLISVAPKK